MSFIHRTTLRAITLGAASLSLFCASAPASGAPIILGDASAFAVLAGASVTNTGSSVVTGELGVSEGTAVTGFPPGVVGGGAIHINDGLAATAKSDFLTAYDALTGYSVTQNLTGGILGVGSLASLSPGVYKFDSTAQLNGTLSLDGGGDPAARFIFLIGSALTTASASSILLNNGTFFDNVYWQTGTAATLGSATAFAGSILAGSSITLDDGASIVCGRALAKTSVTMISNAVSTSCEQVADGGGGDTSVPEPGSLGLLGLGILGFAGVVRQRRDRAASGGAHA